MTSNIVRVASELAGRVAAANRSRRMKRGLANLSSHMLRDIGFTRDWHGGISRLPHESKW
jgi:uncharacterized protein YjiS (DUF1127 family)